MLKHTFCHVILCSVAARMLTVFEDPTTCREKILKCIRLEFLTFFKFSSFQGKLLSLLLVRKGVRVCNTGAL